MTACHRRDHRHALANRTLSRYARFHDFRIDILPAFIHLIFKKVLPCRAFSSQGPPIDGVNWPPVCSWRKGIRWCCTRAMPSAAARDADLQDWLIEACERLSGVGGLSEEALAVRERY